LGLFSTASILFNLALSVFAHTALAQKQWIVDRSDGAYAIKVDSTAKSLEIVNLGPEPLRVLAMGQIDYVDFSQEIDMKAVQNSHYGMRVKGREWFLKDLMDEMEKQAGDFLAGSDSFSDSESLIREMRRKSTQGERLAIFSAYLNDTDHYQLSANDFYMVLNLFPESESQIAYLMFGYAKFSFARELGRLIDSVVERKLKLKEEVWVLLLKQMKHRYSSMSICDFLTVTMYIQDEALRLKALGYLPLKRLDAWMKDHVANSFSSLERRRLARHRLQNITGFSGGEEAAAFAGVQIGPLISQNYSSDFYGQANAKTPEVVVKDVHSNGSSSKSFIQRWIGADYEWLGLTEGWNSRQDSKSTSSGIITHADDLSYALRDAYHESERLNIVKKARIFDMNSVDLIDILRNFNAHEGRKLEAFEALYEQLSFASRLGIKAHFPEILRLFSSTATLTRVEKLLKK
jgi:hypothetical protein